MLMSAYRDPVAEFIDAASAPRHAGHATGSLDEAGAILAAHPQVAQGDIYVAAILGDEQAVRRFLARDPAGAVAKGGPRDWDALTYLCFSRYLRIDRSRSDGFVRAATALLDAGADPNAGWFEADHQPNPVWESALYGAAGVAHHAELTRLLLARGADPNDEETPYHAPEGYDNGAFCALVDSGKLTNDSLATMLLRKCDLHDVEGVAYVLSRGADPNYFTRWKKTALDQAVARDNPLDIIEAMLDHGGDPRLALSGVPATAVAARRGRGDALDLFERRGLLGELQGLDRVLAACAAGDAPGACALAAAEPGLVEELVANGGETLALFAGVGNTRGVEVLLDLGVPIESIYLHGDGYFDVAPLSTALHSAAWRARPATVKLLLQRGAPVDALDARRRTPLELAVRACVDSYWTARRSPESVQALLEAGASADSAPYPSGYGEVDELLRQYGRQA
jgi:ankyrin repeat protein